jgi:hypothetical protein
MFVILIFLKRSSIAPPWTAHDIEHRQVERFFPEQHAVGGRAGRDREIEHEGEEAEPQRLNPLGRMVERGGQSLGLFRLGSPPEMVSPPIASLTAAPRLSRTEA